MTTLRDPFDTTHKKPLKNKSGQVIAELDYIGWSQAADRLDESEVAFDNWSFAIIGIGEDWVHGRLTIGDRHFENIGYAENADQDWKKEVLKDAASDAFKRCAALAGVGRYLYDKDAPSPSRTAPAARQAPTPIQRPHSVDTALDVDEDEANPFDAPPRKLHDENKVCPTHDIPWNGQPGDLWHKDEFGKYCRHPDNVRKAR